MDKRRLVGWVVLAVFIVLITCCALTAAIFTAVGRIQGPPSAGRFSGGAVAIIEVYGTILCGEDPSGMGGRRVSYSGRVADDIQRAILDPAVHAIVLEVSSPGGSVVASADIHAALLACPKPIVTSMVEVAASGGYYVACGTQYIYARPATLTGSIGVITQIASAEELLDTLGIDIQTIKTGAYKDQGGFGRALTSEEIAMLLAILDESYDEFVGVIASGRNMPEDKVREVADGRVLSGRQAVALGLIDELGNLDDAIQKASELGGISGEPRVLRYRAEPSLLDLLSGLPARSALSTESQLLKDLTTGLTPRLLYLYSEP